MPTSVPEIGAGSRCGAEGLHVGGSMLLPGKRSVRDSLAAAGRRSAIGVAGAVVLFGIAGLVEGIFRQAVTDLTLRYALFGFNLLWFTAWLFLAGRTQRVAHATAKGAPS